MEKYFATCGYIGDEFRWYICYRFGILCTSKHRKGLIRSLKRWMKRNDKISFTFVWENSGTTKTVRV